MHTFDIQCSNVLNRNLLLLPTNMAGVQVKVEKDIFTGHYSSLCNTLTDVDNLLCYFVQEKIINPSDVEEIDATETTFKKVEKLLGKIFGPLSAGDTKGFHTMLTIMKEHGLESTKNLAIKISHEITSSNNSEGKNVVLY